MLSDRRYIPPKEDFPFLKFPDVTKELLGKHKVLLKFRNDVEGLDTRAINAIIDFVRKKQAERIENVHFLWNPSDWICIIYVRKMKIVSPHAVAGHANRSTAHGEYGRL